MKILMTSDTYLPRLGGGEYHVYYLCRELRRLQHTVCLFTTEPGVSPHGDEQWVVRASWHGIRSILSLCLSLWRLSNDVDVIHSHYSYRLAFFVGLIARLRGCRFVLTQHGLGLLPQAGATLWQDVIFCIWRYWSMHFAHIIISTSEDLSIDIRKLGFDKKIIAIPNGYDDEVFSLLQSPTSISPVILTVRRLVPKTGIQYLIQSLPILRSQFPNIRCEIIGDGRLRGYLEELAHRLKVQDIVSFLGALNHSALIEHYRNAHVVVIPSTAESTSLSCIEAMALGKVIVASRVGGLIELLGTNAERGTLVPLMDDEHCSYDAPLELPLEKIQLLADAIIHAIQQPVFRERAKIASEYARQNFSWKKIAKATEDAYRLHR